MRRQDEIRLLFPSVDPVCQKLLLSELDAYAQAFDAEDAHDFLWSLTAHAHDAVRWQAQVTLSLFLPRYVAARLGAASQQVSPWSAFRQGTALILPESTAAAKADAARLRAATLAALAPVEQAVCARLHRLPPAARDVARLGLAHAGSPAAQDALLDDFQSHAGGFAALWAHAHGGGARRTPARIVDLLVKFGWRQGDVLLAGMPLPIAELRAVHQRLAGRLDPGGVANLALALARNPAVDAVRDLAPLFEGAAAWTQAFILRALALARQPAALPLVVRAYTSATEPFLRQHALRAAAALPDPDAIELCAAAVARGGEGEVAPALESLVALRCPADRLAALARPHLASSALRARVNALLASHAQSPATWPPAFAELLESSAPLARVEAAFVLGYWQSSRALKVLALQASADPHPAVRQQAIKSLSKYPAGVAYPVLTHLIASAPVPEARSALRVLARTGGGAPAALSDLLVKQVRTHTDAGRRAMLLRALGAHAAVSGHPGGLPELTEALNSSDRATRLAALESFKHLPDQRDRAVTDSLARHARDPDPDVWGAALAARFLGGDVDAVGELAARAASDDTAPRAVLTFTELALLAREVVGERHAGLARALAPDPQRAPTPDAPAALAPEPAVPEDEGEFRAVSVESAVSVEGAGSVEPPVADPVAAVRNVYAAIPRERGEIGPALKAASYLGVVGPRTVPSPRPGRTAAVAAAIAVALFMIWISAGRGSRPSPAPARTGASTALTVTSARGQATAQDPDHLLTAGDVIRAGADLKLAAGARVTLVTESGDIVIATDGCRAGVDVDPASGTLVIALARGSLELEVAAGRRVLVRWLDAVVRAGPGALKLRAPDGRLTVTLARGEAALLRPDGTSTPLGPGGTASWP